MSFDRIAELLTNAQGEPAPTARRLRSMADNVASTTKPGVEHPDHGYGVVVGVTKDGLAEITFGGEPFAVALPIDQVREAT